MPCLSCGETPTFPAPLESNVKNGSTNESSDDALKIDLRLQASETSPLTGAEKALRKFTCNPHPHPDPTPLPPPTPERKH